MYVYEPFFIACNSLSLYEAMSLYFLINWWNRWKQDNLIIHCSRFLSFTPNMAKLFDCYIRRQSLIKHGLFESSHTHVWFNWVTYADGKAGRCRRGTSGSEGCWRAGGWRNGPRWEVPVLLRPGPSGETGCRLAARRASQSHLKPTLSLTVWSPLRVLLLTYSFKVTHVNIGV